MTTPNALDPAPTAPEHQDEVLVTGESLQPRKIEDLTLVEAFGHLIRRPLRTWVVLSRVLTHPPSPTATKDATAEFLLVEKKKHAATLGPTVDWRRLAPLGLMGLTFLIALVVSLFFSASRGSASDRALGIGVALLAFCTLGMGVVAAYTTRMQRLLPLPASPPLVARPARDRLTPYILRIVVIFVAMLWTLGAWALNRNNHFTTGGILCWVMCVFSWTFVCMDRDIALSQGIQQVSQRIATRLRQPFTVRLSWTAVILIVILLVGGWFRFTGLHVYPPDMTSDHVEKALDALRVYDGERPVFFPNNGGREAFQMYYLAVLKSLTGMPISLELLQVGSGLEGMLMILLAWWMGRAIIGDEDRKLGNLTGLIMAAMVAISFWHILLSRLGLRIVSTTLVTTVVIVYLVRALRYNRRSDYLITGLALGAGMYFYQAIRMLPLVVIAGFVIALLLRVRTRRDLGRYVVNLVALIVVALAVFVPLGRYMTQYPFLFWERTTGRVFGDEGIEDPAKAIEAFRLNLPELTSNLGKSLLMFNARGGPQWFDGAPDGTPELDYFAGALFAAGLGLLGARIIRRRDPADWLLPVGIVIMVLPSALAMVYLVAALPLAVMLRMAQERLPGRWPRRTVYGLVVLLMTFAALANANSYFDVSMAYYREAALPHQQAGYILRGFGESTGASGNVFIPAYTNWFDYRAIAIESGDPYWANIIWRDPDPRQNFAILLAENIGTRYEVKPDRELLFFVNPNLTSDTDPDRAFLDFLTQTFPEGKSIQVKAFKPERDFVLYLVPPVGCDWLRQNVGRLPDSCQNPQPDSTTAPQ
jgi:hypothetical protein